MTENVTNKKIAILSTSQCRKDIYDGPAGARKIVKTEPTDFLTDLVMNGYTIYLASTRKQLHPKYDAFLLELIPEERRFLPDPDTDCGHAQAQGLIDMWARVLDTFEIPHPQPEVVPANDDHDGFTIQPTWMDYRHKAEEHGFTVRAPSDLYRGGRRVEKQA